MTNRRLLRLLFFAAPVLSAAANSAYAAGPDHFSPGDPARYDVVWDSPSKSAVDSMPIGNGDIGLNVWSEPGGDLLFYIAKTDAVSENGEFLKLGRVRVHFTPESKAPAAFRQMLHLEDGQIQIEAGLRNVRIWVDANHPEIHVDAAAAEPFTLTASVELWRTAPRTLDLNHDKAPGSEPFGLRELRGGRSVTIDPDIVLPPIQEQIVWMHRNSRSIYPEVFKVEHLDSLLSKYPDPILNRTFGCLMRGSGMKAFGDRSLQSLRAETEDHLTITCLTEQTNTASQWRQDITALARADDDNSSSTAWNAHARWWHEFWQRSWIDVSGDADAEKVSSGYALQRWMMACDARGPLPVKYNGGLFTVGRSFPDPSNRGHQIEDPDWRAWGSNYWFQNTRHLYWPLIASGDFDLLQPWFDMYVHALPLMTDRAALYWHHAGAAFPETIYFFGLPCPADFGWNNASNEVNNTWIRWYWSGGIEMTAMMLARYQYTHDNEFARNALLPFAQAITTFYAEHWTGEPTGKIRFNPAQSLETWQQGVVNPLPDIAGLKYVLPQLISLPNAIASSEQRSLWSGLLNHLPAVPIGPGKDAQLVLLPAEKFQKSRNVENTELYAVYPYRLYGVGLPDIELARRTFAQRRFPGTKCWSQDPIDEALLALTDDAKKDVTTNFTNSGARFQAFWKPEHDWIPDFDNGGAAMEALQWMLMQCDGRRILLLPTWPKAWNVGFKLRAPDQSTVEGAVRNGEFTSLIVSPRQRRQDVEILRRP